MYIQYVYGIRILYNLKIFLGQAGLLNLPHFRPTSCSRGSIFNPNFVNLNQQHGNHGNPDTDQTQEGVGHPFHYLTQQPVVEELRKTGNSIKSGNPSAADIETMAPFGKHALGIGHCNLLHWQFWPPIWHLAHSGTSLRFCNDTSELNLALSVDLDAPETKLRLLQIVKKVQPPACVAIDISNCAIICPLSQCASLPIEVLLPRSWPVPNRMALQGPW